MGSTVSATPALSYAQQDHDVDLLDASAPYTVVSG